MNLSENLFNSGAFLTSDSIKESKYLWKNVPSIEYLCLILIEKNVDKFLANEMIVEKMFLMN